MEEKKCNPFVERICRLIEVKSLVTLALTFGMLMLLLGPVTPAPEVLSLFSMVFGSVTTYFFTRKDRVA